MAVFSHADRSLPYTMELAPLEHDLLLLQGARFTREYWRPVLEDLAQHPTSGGRVVTCDWSESARSPEQMVEDLRFFVETLALQSLRVVACEEAVAVLLKLEQVWPNRIDQTLCFEREVPRGDEMLKAIREFLRIEPAR